MTHNRTTLAPGAEPLPEMPDIPAPDSLEVRIGVVLANTTDSTGEVYLGTFDAQHMAEVLMRVELDPLVDEHRREIARLTQLLDAAHLARDRAQARVAAARGLSEKWRYGGAVLAPRFADQLDIVLDHASSS